MSKKDMVYHIGVDMSADINDVEGKFNKLKGTLSQINLPNSFKKELAETFTRGTQALEEFVKLQGQSGHTEAEINKMGKAYREVTGVIDVLSRKVSGIEALDPNKLLPK